MWGTAGGSPTRSAHTYTHGRHGAGGGAKSAQRLTVEPGAFLGLYKIAHSESMVDGITSPSDFSTIKGAHCGLERTLTVIRSGPR